MKFKNPLNIKPNEVEKNQSESSFIDLNFLNVNNACPRPNNNIAQVAIL